MRKGLWLLAAGALLGACAPRITAEPLPGVRVDVPVQVPPPASPPQPSQPAGQAQGGVTAPVIKVLPGNPLPPAGSAYVDDFSSYPTGAVLPVVAPERYGLLGTGGDWQKITVEEAFAPDGRLDKAVRMEGGYGEGFLTTGAEDWTDYRVSFRLKTLEACCTHSHIRARLFLNGAGSRALEFFIGRDPINGVGLYKLAGDQRFLLLQRRELNPTANAVLRDGNWHDFVFELRGDGTVRVFVDRTEVVNWKDPDYHRGGFGIGPVGVTFQLDDLKVERLGGATPPLPGPPTGEAPPRRENFCGYRAGAELPHERFLADGQVELRLLGGHSAARNYRIGYYPAGKPEAPSYALSYQGNFEPPTCLNPPLVAIFRPQGSFGLAHNYEHYGNKTVYTEDRFNETPRGFRAYEAINSRGEKEGILLLVEDWIDGDFDDVGLLLIGAKPEG